MLLKRNTLGLSMIGGQTSLKTLLDEPDFALASFLLSVMGEGSFLVLLNFIHRYGPDSITRTSRVSPLKMKRGMSPLALLISRSHAAADDGFTRPPLGRSSPPTRGARGNGWPQ